MQSTTSTNSYLVALGLLLALASFGYVYLSGSDALRTAKIANDTAVATEKAKLEEVAVLNEASTKLQEKEAALQAQGITFESLAAVLPADENMPTLYIQMENLIGKAGQTVKDPTYTLGVPVLGADGKVKIPVSITGSATYQQLKDYLALVETNVRPISLTTVTFAAVGEPGKPDANKYNLNASGYILARSLSPAYGAVPTSL